MSRLVCIVLLVVGCGGGQKTGPADQDQKACERGRCLDDIAKLVQEHRAEARACYDTHAKDGGGGRIIINFEIDPAGKVVEASKSVKDGQIENDEAVACIADVIKEIQFPPSAA